MTIARLSAFGPLLLASLASCAAAQEIESLTTPYTPEQCGACAGWNEPQEPFRIFGNTHYVGSRGLSAILLTGPEGHILIDGGLPDTAPLIIANIEALGFDIGNVELIVNSHAHFDHAGGVAALQRASGGRVAATASSAAVLESGRASTDDPQYGIDLPMPMVRDVDTFGQGDLLRVGEVAIRAILTPGHTPGGTSWSWVSCEGDECLDFVYADSLTPVSAPDFRYSDSAAYPNAVADFEAGFARLEAAGCDVLLTPHPDASSFWDRWAGGAEGLVDTGACRRYAEGGRALLERRLTTETDAR